MSGVLSVSWAAKRISLGWLLKWRSTSRAASIRVNAALADCGPPFIGYLVLATSFHWRDTGIALQLTDRAAVQRETAESPSLLHAFIDLPGSEQPRIVIG